MRLMMTSAVAAIDSMSLQPPCCGRERTSIELLAAVHSRCAFCLFRNPSLMFAMLRALLQLAVRHRLYPKGTLPIIGLF